MYSREFDNRKRVFQYSPDNVVREMSAILEFIMDQAVHDMDAVFSREYGAAGGNYRRRRLQQAEGNRKVPG